MAVENYQVFHMNWTWMRPKSKHRRRIPNFTWELSWKQVMCSSVTFKAERNSLKYALDTRNVMDAKIKGKPEKSEKLSTVQFVSTSCRRKGSL